MPQEVLTRRRPPAVARALRDTRRTPRGGSVALGAPVRRRRAPRAARVPRSPRTGQGAETLLAVVGLGLTGVGALSAARAALGPATGTGVLGAAMPSMLVLVLAMAAVLLALRRLARGGEDHRPVWLVGLATLVLVAS